MAGALLIATGWITFDFLFAPGGADTVTVEIPDFCGQMAEECEFDAWLDVETVYRYDADVPAGTVLSQSPTAGSRRKLNAQSPQCALSLVVSLGEETVELPNVLGQDAREAVSRLREIGLRIETATETGAYPEGTVFAMEPRAGTVLPVGSKVSLHVSAGTPGESVTVPDVRGLSRSDALIRLWLARLAVGEVTEEPSDSPAGTVIRQSHQPGTLVGAGTKITLAVSSGEE